MENIRAQDFESCVSEKEYCVLFFSSPMNVNCVLAENALSCLEDGYSENTSFFKSDITEDVALAQKFSVFSVPRVCLFHNGSPVDALSGAVSHSVMKAFLDRTISH